jgi:hypothetical protein
MFSEGHNEGRDPSLGSGLGKDAKIENSCHAHNTRFRYHT